MHRAGRSRPAVKINVAEVPIDTLHQQIFSDLSTGLGRYDAYMTGHGSTEISSPGKEPYIVEIEPFLKDPKHSLLGSESMFTCHEAALHLAGKDLWRLVRRDCQILYYRKDILEQAGKQQKFKDKLGYDLPNPPKTMKEMHDLATFFTGWDWNGDGQNDWGISLHAKVNEQGFFHFLTLSAPYVISTDNKYYFFNPDTMKPLINSEGHLRALEEYVEIPGQWSQGADQLDARAGMEFVPCRARCHGTDVG